ncbi:MAG: ABC transporter permease [Bacillota bacterium]|nr:ABC transporter permease [Bacillota bacterium]
MYNLIRADLFKMGKSSVVKVLFGITSFSAVIMAVMAYMIAKGKLDPGMAGIGFMFSDIDMISILGAVIAGVFICGDFDNKTIHDAVACGCSRGSILVSKAIVLFCALIFILLPYIITTVIALSTGSKFSMGSVGVGFLNILTQESGTACMASVFFKLLITTLTLIIVYAAQLSLCIPFAVIFKKPVLVVAVYYGITILFAQITRLRNSFPMFESIFSCMPF